MTWSRRKLNFLALVIIGALSGCAKAVVVPMHTKVVWKKGQEERGMAECNKVFESEGKSNRECGSSLGVKIIHKLSKHGGGRVNGLAWLMTMVTNSNGEIVMKEDGEIAESPGGMIINGVTGMGKSISKMGKRLKYGFGKMWTNDKLARAIRKRVRSKNTKSKIGTAPAPMTYGELMVIRSAREDGQKALSMAVILTLMPELLWVALRFIPSIVPSAFTFPEEKLTHQKRYDRLRLSAALQLQQSLDEMCSSQDKKKAAESKAWSSVIQHVLKSTSPSRACEALRPMFYTKEEGQSQGGRTVSHGAQAMKALPQPVVKALSEAFGLTFPFVPTFFQRRRVKKYIDRIVEGDRVLISGGPLSSLSEFELRDACCERAIGIQGCKKEAMERSLERWIEMTMSPSTLPEEVVWVPERARLIALGLSTLWSVRRSREAQCCRELFEGGI